MRAVLPIAWEKRQRFVVLIGHLRLSRAMHDVPPQVNEGGQEDVLVVVGAATERSGRKAATISRRPGFRRRQFLLTPPILSTSGALPITKSSAGRDLRIDHQSIVTWHKGGHGWMTQHGTAFTNKAYEGEANSEAGCSMRGCGGMGWCHHFACHSQRGALFTVLTAEESHIYLRRSSLLGYFRRHTMCLSNTHDPYVASFSYLSTSKSSSSTVRTRSLPEWYTRIF